MKRIVCIAGFIVIALSLSLASAEEFAIPEGKNPFTVPTFECLGVYYTVDSVTPGECLVSYRKKGATAWKEALPLWFDARDKQFRGSIVGLSPATDYDIKLSAGGKETTFAARTRSENFPVGKTTYIDGGVTDTELHITEAGEPGAWHLVTPAQGQKTTFDCENSKDCSIVVEASYVIIRGFELKNAARHGILITRGVHDVLIENCRVTHWGRSGGPRSFGDEGGGDSAVYAEKGASGIIVQNNLFEDPRGASNDWETGHPNGPQCVSLIDSGGGNIIRYNEMRSTEDHGFNDAIGGGSNYSFEGSPCRDSDIYGNIISNVWDDGIESEGANMNVRIWGNYIHHTYQHVATAVTSKGPLYIFRNIFGVSRRTYKNTLGGSMIKLGEREPFIGGRRYVFHNTALQPQGAFSVFSSHPLTNVVSRNNVFDCPGTLTGRREPAVPSDLDYDLFTGISLVPGYEEHGISGKPAFVESTSLEFYPAPTTTRIEWGVTTTVHDGKELRVTDKVMTVPNPIIDAGIRIPNFNDVFAGEAPDLGAFERGAPPILFGRKAGGRTELAPWE